MYIDQFFLQLYQSFESVVPILPDDNTVRSQRRGVAAMVDGKSGELPFVKQVEPGAAAGKPRMRSRYHMPLVILIGFLHFNTCGELCQNHALPNYHPGKHLHFLQAALHVPVLLHPHHYHLLQM